MLVDNNFYISYNKYVRDKLFKRRDVKKQDVEDLVQDVFEKCKLYEDYFDPDKGSVKGWLAKMVIHVVDRSKRGSDIMDNPFISLDTSYFDEDDEEVSLYETLTEDDSFYEKESDYYYLDNRPEVTYYVDQLEERQRQVLEFKLILGYTHNEIADTLGISASTSAAVLKEAVKSLEKLVNSIDDVELLQHKFKGAHTESIKSNNDSGVNVWNDWSWKPVAPGPVKIYSESEIKQYLKGE